MIHLVRNKFFKYEKDADFPLDDMDIQYPTSRTHTWGPYGSQFKCNPTWPLWEIESCNWQILIVCQSIKPVCLLRLTGHLWDLVHRSFQIGKITSQNRRIQNTIHTNKCDLGLYLPTKLPWQPIRRPMMLFEEVKGILYDRVELLINEGYINYPI